MSEELKETSTAVHAHLTIMQSVIQRMASNSSSCKAWCITLVSAILVIVADKGKPQYAWIAVIPTLLFYILDSYYLALEKEFRESYNNFVEKLHNRKIAVNDLFLVAPAGDIVGSFFKAVFSFSTFPFYAVLILMIYIAQTLVIGSVSK